jgi:predicted nucleic acid-binding protein
LSLVLIDASAWIDYLRSGQSEAAAALEQLLAENRAALCGLALAEVRQGLWPDEESEVLELFDVLPWLETTRADYQRAGEILTQLRRRGVTIPTMDRLVAAHCLEREIPLLENDRHFREVEGLELYV